MSHTPLHDAARSGDMDRARELLEHGRYDVNCVDQRGWTPLHYACSIGYVDMIRMLISEFQADTALQHLGGHTPLQSAAYHGQVEAVLALINEFGCDTNVRDSRGNTLLHTACERGYLTLTKTLIQDFNADVNEKNDALYTPLHLAAQAGKEDIAIALINEFSCSTPVKKGWLGRTLLQSACEGGCLNLVRTLIRDHNADVNSSLQLAAEEGKEDIVIALINEFSCSTSVKGWYGRTLLHSACEGGCLNLVRRLIQDHNADVYARDDENDTPLHLAAHKGKEDIAIALINEFSCSTSVKDRSGRTVLHSACEQGCLTLVRTLMLDHNVDINAQDDNKDTPLHLAARKGKEDIAIALINEFSCSTSVKDRSGRTVLHSACKRGCLALVRTLMLDHNVDINAQDDNKDTPLHLAARKGKEDIAIALINEFSCSTSVKDRSGRTVLHSACKRGCLALVRTLIHDRNVDINAQDNDKDTPLHIAISAGKESIALTLINELGCDKNVRNGRGDNCLHTASLTRSSLLVKALSEHVSLMTTNNNGNTPLHLASTNYLGRDCVKELLLLGAPTMVRNAAGETARDIAHYSVKPLLDAFITANQAKIYAHYEELMHHANNIYANAERITRIFVIGNSGAGKSTFVETMKREGFFESFYKVSVPPHTAGIVPSGYTSKLYGRVLFYDFAGDPEYYSSHAAILENLASSTKGDNIFILVVDLREDILKARNIMDYWVSFIEHQKFFVSKKNLLIIGSHSDLLTNAEVDEKKELFEQFCKKNTLSTWHNEIAYFILNCRKPWSNKQLQEIRGRIVDLTKDSPCYKLSTEASVLLGLLEKDFSNVTACSAQTILSHIEDTGVSLAKNIASLMPILEELHHLGFLFVIGIDICDIPHVILNMSQLTNEVHQLLFSKKAKTKFTEGENPVSSLNVGILPQSVLDSLLPQYITKECLVKLQYCQEISQHDIGVFPSLTQPDSSDQSYLFFPALCTASKDDVSQDTPPSLSYSIGWLAQCASTSCDYFPPRFLHVLLLRLVFGFTLAVPAQQPSTNASPDHTHLKRRCTMWNCGVQWSMEEGVECMVELVNGNKGVAVITHSEDDAKENCISVFHDVISCVMEAKAKFCHSIRPQFFLLNPSQSADYLHEDNLFAMSDVERVLASRNKREVLSFNGKGKLKCERITRLCRFTLWNILFSLDFRSVVHYLEDVVRDLYKLFIYLGLPKSCLDTIEANFPNNVDRRRTELVGVWISSSSPDPPCWWQLVQALKEIKYGRLAQDIETKHSECMQ